MPAPERRNRGDVMRRKNEEFETLKISGRGCVMPRRWLAEEVIRAHCQGRDEASFIDNQRKSAGKIL
jgi:hypothetical protein